MDKREFTLSLIVAAADNNVIGFDGKMPWHLPEDLKYFKNTTWGMPVIMGRKTFEAMGKPLPGRKNIVVTSNADWQAPDATVATSLDDAIEKAQVGFAKELFVIGGGEIYKQAIDRADKIYMTRVMTCPQGDTWFPKINLNQFAKASERMFKADEKNAFDLRFEVWVKKDVA